MKIKVITNGSATHIVDEDAKIKQHDWVFALDTNLIFQEKNCLKAIHSFPKIYAKILASSEAITQNMTGVAVIMPEKQSSMYGISEQVMKQLADEAPDFVKNHKGAGNNNLHTIWRIAASFGYKANPATLTPEQAIGFAEWCGNNADFYIPENIWTDGDGVSGTKWTTKELFDLYMESIRPTFSPKLDKDGNLIIEPNPSWSGGTCVGEGIKK